MTQIEKESFWADLRKLISCGYLPKSGSVKDKLTFWAVILNGALIILYTILTASVFKPWWVGYTIGIWVGIT